MLNETVNIQQQAEWIAEQMGWTTLDVQSKYNHVIKTTQDGIELKLWVSVEGGRLKVSADSMGLYEFTWHAERFPTITCSLDKTPAQIARDIERRIIPSYKALLINLMERKAVHDERKRKQLDCCQQLADILGAEVRGGEGHQTEPRVYCYGKGTASIEFIVSSDTNVEIKIRSARFEAAKQIAHTTQEWLRYGWNQDNEQSMLEREEEERSQ